MKKIILFFVMFSAVLFLLVACSKKTEDKVQIANPASTYCIEQGGKLEIRDSAEGQYGVCTLPNGTECEEWKYFRKECP